MLQAGQQFAHFKIIRELGSGGMGAVYLAEDLKLHREVALKILLAEFFNDAERLQRFQREARMAAQISHPNVMGIYDIGSEPDPATGRELEYIVMERVKGIPLGEYFQSATPDIGGVIRIGGKIAAGLAAAHKLGIAHRDIKASNILIDEEGNPKILDFGLAKPTDPVQFGDSDSTDTVSQELTRAGRIVGTVSYMSPEQARGETIDVRTDIFSFGVLLYRMATGEFPFSGQSQVSTLAKILEARHQPPRAKNANIPAELERIIDKCLQKDPNDRYQSAGDLAVDLRNLRRQYDSGVTESISGEYRRSKTFIISGKKAAAAIIGVAVLVVAVVAAMKLVSGGQSGGRTAADGGVGESHSQVKAVAVFDFENKTGDSTLDWLRTGLPEILMTDLAQTGAITVISRERVLDHLRVDFSAADTEEMRQEIEAAQQEVREALKNDGVAALPGVKEALDLARVSVGGMTRNVSHSEMVKAAQALGATSVLSGAFFKMGDLFRIDARLEDAESGRIILAEKVVGEEPMALVDSLTDKIAASLDVQNATADQSIASVTTKSPEAYKLYHDAMDLFALEMYDEAIPQFEAATRIDPAFALAYLRIGMAHMFQGRIQQGQRYLAKAKENRNNLPVQARSLLNIFTDLWLDQQFDAGFMKLQAYVDNYPADKEVRAFYGMATWQLSKDTATALAQLDTILMSDPANQTALSWKGAVLEQMGLTDSALTYYELVKKYHPESPAGPENVAALYRDRGDVDKALVEYRLMARMFPAMPAPWNQMAQLAIRRRSFDEAAEYLEEFRRRAGGDLYRMNSYELALANLAQWQGKFWNAFDHVYKALDYGRQSGDSGLVRNAYSILFAYFDRYEMKDSALACLQDGAKWAGVFANLDLAMSYVQVDPAYCDTAAKLLQSGTKEFKERTPSTMWPIVEQLQIVFDGHCTGDTAKMIDGMLGLSRVQQPRQGLGNLRSAGTLMVYAGRYKEGKEILEKFLSGQDEITSGFAYPYTLYLVGVAEEGLGNRRAAAARFEEMLRYWGKPDIEVKEISDARQRLARLTG